MYHLSKCQMIIISVKTNFLTQLFQELSDIKIRSCYIIYSMISTRLQRVKGDFLDRFVPGQKPDLALWEEEEHDDDGDFEEVTDHKKSSTLLREQSKTRASFRRPDIEGSQMSFDFPAVEEDPNQRKIHFRVLPHRRGVPEGISKEIPDLFKFIFSHER